MVSGCSIAVTRVPSVSQCAETQSTALGLGSDRATAAHARLNSLSSMAFIGLPCPMNRAGIVVSVSGAAARVRMMESVAIEFSSAAPLGGNGGYTLALLQVEPD